MPTYKPIAIVNNRISQIVPGDKLQGMVANSGASTDMAIAKWAGTAGDTITNTGVLIDSNNALYRHYAKMVLRSFSFSVTNADCGCIYQCINSSEIIVTLPSSLATCPVGYQCAVIQAGTGKVVFTAEHPTPMISYPAGAIRTPGQGVTIWIVRGNSEWILGGKLEPA